ncbi:hypothetical protein GCM10012275_41800 [Longimycelium tulufanense]|uniref:Uncharacterized protein n=1 Tax=Longimycelium tulufanense TaxID=907463 RepID=A0A8J3CH74_9PSEU|nr:hypothetical protein GCM10012275_41800 [Longimycelium tulufanense]
MVHASTNQTGGQTHRVTPSYLSAREGGRRVSCTGRIGGISCPVKAASPWAHDDRSTAIIHDPADGSPGRYYDFR